MFLFVVIELDFWGGFSLFLCESGDENVYTTTTRTFTQQQQQHCTCAALSDFSHMTGTLLLVGLSCRGILCEDL